MLTKFRLAASSVVMTAALLITAGCNTQPDHPNQINAFDGACYDSLTLAHGALASLRTELAGSYPEYDSAFNQAAGAYSIAFDAYSVFRTDLKKQPDVTVALGNLALGIINLENAIQTDLHVSQNTAQKVQRRAAKMRAMAGSSVTAIDILTELEIAASIAETVPSDKPYAELAALVIGATQHALAAEGAASGQPIDLSTVEPVTPLP